MLNALLQKLLPFKEVLQKWFPSDEVLQRLIDLWPLYLGALVVCLVFTLIVLVELSRIDKRRENEEMFGTQAFDEKVDPKRTSELD